MLQKQSTFNGIQMPDKSFRAIALIVFQGGVTTNCSKICSTIDHIFLNNTQKRTKFYGEIGFM